MLRLLGAFKGLIPPRFRLPASYWNQRIRNNLEKEMFMLERFAAGGERAIDVGANIGFYSYALSRICTHVEAFEPVPHCARILEAYNAPNIHVHRVALSSVNGVKFLKVPVTAGRSNYLSASFMEEYSGEFESLDVPVRRLDDYDFRGVRFIKIDVEGHEAEVMEGGRETIARERPVLLIEIEQRFHDVPIEKIFNDVIEMGYSGFFLFQGDRRPISDFSYDMHQKPFLDDPVRKGYVNNFVFVPKRD